MTAPGHPTHGSRLRWRGLVPGIVFLTTIVMLAAGVLVFADIGAVRGTTIPVHVAFAEAREIIPNTEVWLNGERIGAVRSVQFQPATSEPDKRLVVTLDLLEVARPYVRRDATVQVRRGESFLGAPVIYVSGGTASTHAVRPGDTLATTIWLDQDELSEQIRVGFTDARTVMANVRRTAGAIQEAQGSLAGLFAGEGSAQLSELQQVRTSLAGLTSGDGALLSFTGDSGLIAQVESTRLALDSLEINSRSGSGRRMLDDSTLRVATSSVAAKVSALRADIRARVAPLRRGAPSDSAGARSAALARLDTALTMLLQDIRRRPWRYVSF